MGDHREPRVNGSHIHHERTCHDDENNHEDDHDQEGDTHEAHTGQHSRVCCQSQAKGNHCAEKPKAATGAKQAAQGQSKRRGILDIAAEMIAKSKKPMGCKEIVEQAIEKGLWKTKGQTPSATLYAAIIREIIKKGKDARFKKVDRGLFTAAKAGLK